MSLNLFGRQFQQTEQTFTDFSNTDNANYDNDISYDNYKHKQKKRRIQIGSRFSRSK